MEYFWAILVSSIFLLIVFAILSHKQEQRRIREATDKIFPRVTDHIQVDRRYNVFLSHGKTIKNVRFVGISPSHDQSNVCLPFPLCQWLIVEKENGKRAYLKPESVRYYEDVEEDDPNNPSARR